jgi:TolB-like protein
MNNRVGQAAMLWLLGAGIAQAQASAAVEGFDVGIARVARNLAQASSARVVAVLDFPDYGGRTTQLSVAVAENLITELAKSSRGTLRIVERRQVSQVLKELAFARTDLTVDEAATLGERLGADGVVLGTAAVVDGRVLLNARVVGVANRTILSAERMAATAEPHLLSLARLELMPGGASQAGTIVNPVPAYPASATTYENDFIRVAAEASVAPSGEKANVVLTIENKSASEEFIGYNSKHGEGVQLVDSKANSWRLSELTGLAACYLPCGPNLPHFTRIAPGGRQTVVLSFHLDGYVPGQVSHLRPSTVSFSLVAYRRRGEMRDRLEAFTVGLSGIPIATAR